jgi:outer membrane protein insertion porin family/translocation and assembly module TamA
MAPRLAGTGTRALFRSWLVALFAVTSAVAPAAHAQDIECDRDNEREVGAVKFVGNRTFSTDELSARVLTTASSFTRRHFKVIGARRCYPSNGLGPDVAALKQYYQNNGFYDTTVDTVVSKASNTAVDVTFRINEGAPIRLDTLRIEGLELVDDTASILKDLQLRVGGRFGRDLMVADVDTILTRLRNAGYPRPDYLRSYTVNRAQHRATVGIEVIPGPLARFGAIDVTTISARGGAGEIDSTVVRGLIGIKTGQRYSARALAEGTRNLYNLGVYRHVGLDVDTMWTRGDSVADIRVDLREDLIHQWDLNEGWATLDCFRVNTQLTNKNFLDKAQRLELTGRLSKIGFGKPTDFAATHDLCRRHVLEKDTASSVLNYYAGATLRRPTLFGTHWVPSYSAYTERSGEYQAYLRTTYLGGEAAATRELGRGLPFRAAYTMEYGHTIAQPAILCAIFKRCNRNEQDDFQNTRRLAITSGSIQWIQTNDPVEPTTGFVIGGEIRGSSQYFLSDPSVSFLKVTADVSWYRQITRGSVFFTRLRGGATSLANLLPPQERLYAGGANSVRGFQQNELGPIVYLFTSLDTTQFKPDTDAVNSTISYIAKPGATSARRSPGGGNSLFVVNTELRIRDPFFPQLLEYVPFVDAGQVWTREPGTKQLNIQRAEITPGLGIRVFSPVGPIQLNAGYNPGKPRPGPAYFAAPVDPLSGQAPLLCVTGFGETPVPIKIRPDGRPDPDAAATCPATFAPARSSNFFRRLTLTLSIGNGF